MNRRNFWEPTLGRHRSSGQPSGLAPFLPDFLKLFLVVFEPLQNLESALGPLVLQLKLATEGGIILCYHLLLMKYITTTRHLRSIESLLLMLRSSSQVILKCWSARGGEHANHRYLVFL
jgi:hypothetical protein